MRSAAYGYAYLDKFRAHFNNYAIWSTYVVSYSAGSGGMLGAL